MKVMSIIGIVLFSICLIGVITLSENDPESAVGAGLLGLLYALPFAITSLVKSNKQHEKR